MNSFSEHEFISMLSRVHGTKPYLSDAEIMKNADGTYELFSIDSFSEQEDFFTSTPPETTGANIAAGAMSDLFASGATPHTFLASWDVDSSKGLSCYEKIASGMEKTLSLCGTVLRGGDIGSSVPWRCCCAVSGRANTPPVRRKTSRRIPFKLCLSGGVGDANLAMLQGRAMPEFECRHALAPLIGKHALFATDTSGGFFDALENFRRVNHGMLLEVNTADALHADVKKYWPQNEYPHEFALIGGVGEYELLFALPEDFSPPDGVSLLEVGSGFFRDGVNENSFTLKGGGRMENPPPDYREIPPEKRIAETWDYYKEITRK